MLYQTTLGENEQLHKMCHASVLLDEFFLYLTDQNSKIEFSLFPDDTRKNIVPEKNDLLLFDSNIFHRVLESDKERISLAFNFDTHGI